MTDELTPPTDGGQRHVTSHEWPNDSPPTRFALGFTLEQWACVRRSLMTNYAVSVAMTTALHSSDQERREAELEVVTITDILAAMGDKSRQAPSDDGATRTSTRG